MKRYGVSCRVEYDHYVEIEVPDDASELEIEEAAEGAVQMEINYFGTIDIRAMRETFEELK